MHGKSREGISLDVRTNSGEQNIEGSDILVAAGRVPNTAGIGLGEVGIELDGRGYIRVNERLETSAPDVWALGECAGSPLVHPHIRRRLSHRSRQSGRRAAKHARSAGPGPDVDHLPLAHVGFSEGDAERQGVITRVAKLPTSAVLRAQATGEKPGLHEGACRGTVTTAFSASP